VKMIKNRKTKLIRITFLGKKERMDKKKDLKWGG